LPPCTEIGLCPGHIVLDGDPAPHPQKGHGNPPLSQFTDATAAYVYCGQMARWIRMPLVSEAGLGPGNIVLDGDPAPPRKEA